MDYSSFFYPLPYKIIGGEETSLGCEFVGGETSGEMPGNPDVKLNLQLRSPLN